MGPKKKAGSVLVVENLTDYFLRQLRRAVQNQKTEVPFLMETYLARLLSSFVHVEKLFPESKDGDKEHSLALMYFEAMDASAEKQRVMLQKMADLSLYMSGYFSSSLNNRVVNPESYTSMGSSAYYRLACIAEKIMLKEIFMDLSRKFDTYTGLLGEVADKSRMWDNRDILTLYEKWLKSGDAYLLKMLTELGVLHTEPKKRRASRKNKG